ncbi:MAG: phosphoribosylformylglycinamidine synthase subunit PurS, partial [Dehalococcoidia bacterium]|nr:phosphoribosylformylglycinamidine synthase subunit PurS [Dehalococcoidia bacterium]
MASNIVRVEVTPKQGEGMRDVRGESVKRQLSADHGLEISSVRSVVGFLVKSELDSEAIGPRVDDLFTDPIIETGTVDALVLEDATLFPNRPDISISIGFKPGVTDNPGKAALDGFQTIF